MNSLPPPRRDESISSSRGGDQSPPSPTNTWTSPAAAATRTQVESFQQQQQQQQPGEAPNSPWGSQHSVGHHHHHSNNPLLSPGFLNDTTAITTAAISNNNLQLPDDDDDKDDDDDDTVELDDRGLALDFALFDAELLRETGGALSAPPPPGFEGPEERSRLVHELLFNSQQQHYLQFYQQQQPQQQDDRQSRSSTDSSNTIGGGGNHRFTNLAAVLGTGLVESMDDSTKELQHQQQLNQFDAGERLRGLSSLSETMFDPSQDLSYARQYRHAASRMIGTSPPKVDLGFTRTPGGTRGEPPSSLFQSTPMRGGVSRKVETGHLTLPPSFKPRNSNNNSNSSNNNAGIRLGSAFLPSANNNNDYQAIGGPIRPAAGKRRDAPGTTRLSSLIEDDSRLASTNDVGVTVMEPTDLFGRTGTTLGGSLFQPRQFRAGSDRSDDGSFSSELEQNLRHPLVTDAAAAARLAHKERTVRISPAESDSSHLRSEPFADTELQPFLWEYHQGEPSRCLAILRAPSLHVPDVRSTCEAFGVLEIFRADFADRSVFFVAYYDIRSAQYAALELQACLNGMLSPEGSEKLILVYFCVPLNSSTQNDESTLVLTGIPPHEDDEAVLSMLSAYGSVRSLTRQGGSYGGSSFVAEFHDVQDAKQAMLELETTHPWGDDVAVELGARSPVDRKRGRELLALIGRWRQSRNVQRRLNNNNNNVQVMEEHQYAAQHRQAGLKQLSNRGQPGPGSSASSSPPPSMANYSEREGYSENASRAQQQQQQQQTTQLVLGPDGRYSYVVVNQAGGGPPFGGAAPSAHVEFRPQQYVQLPHGAYTNLVPVPPGAIHSGGGQQQQQQVYWTQQGPVGHIPHYSNPPHHYLPHGATVISSPQYIELRGTSYPSTSSTPYSYPAQLGQTASRGDSSNTGNPAVMVLAQPKCANTDESNKDNRHLMLDLDAVENGRDSRTSLMVRNIPNKYTQQMLLSEFAENGHGPGKIDFFYLPIDFKNRCNRGYAFINFVDYRDILPFHLQYYGKHWRAFNSDKICDVTYARIQGKAAMLKRFENSALMEKDEEYKPLVFVSLGAEKGQRIPFPARATTADHK